VDGDDGVSIDSGIHKGKGQCKKMQLSGWTCVGGARVFIDQSARQGTYNDGVGNGVGVVKAKVI
jgi:hypothetical protein